MPSTYLKPRSSKGESLLAMSITATMTGAPPDSKLTMSRSNHRVSILPFIRLIFLAFCRCSNPNSSDLYPSDLAGARAPSVCFRRRADMHAAMLP